MLFRLSVMVRMMATGAQGWHITQSRMGKNADIFSDS